MKINLNKKDLISLVKGTSPNYHVMEHPLIKANGHFAGGHFGWSWNWNFTPLSEKELYRMYLICKESWDVKEGTNN